jgi:uncharacterized protein (DUF885 family)
MNKLLAAVAAIALVSCGKRQDDAPFPELLNQFVTTALSYSPVTATGAGYHVHDGTPLDELIDSYGELRLQEIRKFYQDSYERFSARAKAGGLDAQQAADWALVRNHIELERLELDDTQRYKHDPTLYTEVVGSALYTPFVLDYAPLPVRYKHIIQRMRQIPALLGEARQNLRDAPEVMVQVASAANMGNRDLVNITLFQAAPEPMKLEYERAITDTVRSMDEFDAFLRGDLSKRRTDWRLGGAAYARKFRAALGTDRGPDEVLREAEFELERVRSQMYRLAAPLYPKLVGRQPPPKDRDATVSAVLAAIAARHATRDTYFADAVRDLAEAREFVRAKGFVPLPVNDNLRVIATPEFMRGAYAVGGFVSAPPLEPKLGAYYWLTPIPPTWDDARVESKLREYNHYGLKILTIHEAIPGHYLQFEFSNTVESRERRLVRSLFANGPYVEGWAVYATELMIEHGYLDNDPALLLTFLKQMLRVIANAILDIRLHAKGMTDHEALHLMTELTYQEKEEAEAKLVRAKLTSAQLPTYFVGWREWRAARQRAAARPGFSLAAFHEAALRAGAVPVSELDKLLSSGK